MNTAEFSVNLTKKDIQDIIMRYHFRKEDEVLLFALYHAMQPFVRIKGYYQWKNGDDVIQYKEYAVVFLTLGDGIDDLQDLYMNKGCLSEAYMLECISLEMLMKAYEELVKQLQREYGKWVEKIDFLGDTYPMELLPELYHGFEGITITYNEQLVLIPGKSVVFLLPVIDKQIENPCHICKNCKNEACLFRKKEQGKDNESSREWKDFSAGKETDFAARRLEISASNRNTYGYQRIFGKEIR